MSGKLNAMTKVLSSIEYKTIVAYCFLGQSPMWSPLFWYGCLFILEHVPIWSVILTWSIIYFQDQKNFIH